MTNSYSIKLLDGREVCYSYGIPIAAFIPGRGYVMTDRKYSKTTTTHALRYTQRNGKVIPDAEFCRLIVPVDPERKD